MKIKKELDFAYKVRHALNETIDALPASTAQKLASARKVALSHKKKDLPWPGLMLGHLLVSRVARFFNDPLSWFARMGSAVPIVVLIVGLSNIYQYEQQRRIDDTAEMDAAVLVDELPLSAYLDDGFNAYLESREE